MKWEKSVEAAKKVAASTRKPILLDFYATWCGPCRKMEEETFRDAGVRALMARMVCVRLDVDGQPPQAAQFGVTSIPRLIVLPAGGGEPLMDVQGYADPGRLAPELRRALGLRPDEVVTPAPESEENAALTRVREALRKKQYAALKASDPKLASAGLNQLVVRLGVFKEADLAPQAALLKSAGNDAVPALLKGMGHRYLAVRAGSYRVLQEILREGGRPPSLSFDPWAATGIRQSQLQRWAAWWKRRAL